MKIIESIKRLSSAKIKKSVLAQKNEWPATSAPIYFQPERPVRNEKPEKQG